jgi:hypothetical protein
MLLTVLILFVLSAPFTVSTSALHQATSASPIPTTTMYLNPYRINGTAGDNINITAEISDANQMDGYQVGLIWSNPAVAQCTGFTFGNIVNQLPTGEYIEIAPSVNNTAGLVAAGAADAYYPYTMNGSGSMFIFTFHMLETGYSDVHLNDMFLTYLNASVIPCNTIDYYTVVRGGHQYIVRLQGNPTEPPGTGGFGAMSVSSPSGHTGYAGNMTFEINGTSDDLPPPGTFAYFNATIPNELMNCTSPSDWIVILDGSEQSGVLVNTGAQNTTISLSTTSDPSFYYSLYSSGLVTLTINILSNNSAVPEFASTFSSVLLATSLVLAAFVAALFTIKSRSRKQKS